MIIGMLSISLTDKTSLKELFSKTKLYDIKEQSNLNGPNDTIQNFV